MPKLDVPFAWVRTKPKILLACSDTQFGRWRDNPFIGRLITPAFRSSEYHRYTGVDNYAFTDWNPERFVQTLREQEQYAGMVRWVACPDVVGDWETTYARFDVWKDVVRGFGYKPAYVLQDGQPEDYVPWNDLRAVFLGGSTEYKLSDEAFNLCVKAKDKGKYVHVGRVNSIKRISRFLDVMDSFDGLSYSMYRDVKIPPVLKFLESRAERNRRKDV